MNILLEDKRSALLSKSKAGANYRSRPGENRYKRRLKSKIAASIKNFNNIDMNKFFKTDILDVIVDIKGETNNYQVRMSFMNTLEELHKLMRSSGTEEVDRKMILKALTRTFSTDDVYVNCTCPDWKYRFKHWATIGDFLVGDPENRPNRFDYTNKDNNMGSGCKHVNLVLSDSSWLIKVAAVIYNYINYMKDNNERLYQKYIYPAIYQQPYENQQLSIFDDEDEIMDSDEDAIKTSNELARERGRFKQGNEYRFKPAPDKNQITLDDLEAELDNDEENTNL